MTEQKFFPGDPVRVRPFEEIDWDDVGNLDVCRTGDPERQHCYYIYRSTIEESSLECDLTVLEYLGTARGSHVYRLIRPGETEHYRGYKWAQGMLYPASDPEPVVIPDEDIETIWL